MNTPNQGQGSHPECDNASGSEFNLGDHASNHTGESGNLIQNLISDIVESPPHNNTNMQKPIPKTRSSYISSSQPVITTSSIIDNKRRELSLSPENTSEYLSKPKVTRVHFV